MSSVLAVCALSTPVAKHVQHAGQGLEEVIHPPQGMMPLAMEGHDVMHAPSHAGASTERLDASLPADAADDIDGWELWMMRRRRNQKLSTELVRMARNRSSALGEQEYAVLCAATSSMETL